MAPQKVEAPRIQHKPCSAGRSRASVLMYSRASCTHGRRRALPRAVRDLARPGPPRESSRNPPRSRRSSRESSRAHVRRPLAAVVAARRHGDAARSFNPTNAFRAKSVAERRDAATPTQTRPLNVSTRPRSTSARPPRRAPPPTPRASLICHRPCAFATPAPRRRRRPAACGRRQRPRDRPCPAPKSTTATSSPLNREGAILRAVSTINGARVLCRALFDLTPVAPSPIVDDAARLSLSSNSSRPSLLHSSLHSRRCSPQYQGLPQDPLPIGASRRPSGGLRGHA